MKTLGIIVCIVLLWIIAGRLRRIDCALNGPSCELTDTDLARSKL